ncbi:hypothetical protein CP556_00640 [Natrinema sp. CBA1119]|nr:hypothetical protein CP556_00640 [Natrinema sp. CBA1119]
MDGDGDRDRDQSERDRNIAPTSLASTETRIYGTLIRGVYATISTPNSPIVRPNGKPTSERSRRRWGCARAVTTRNGGTTTG